MSIKLAILKSGEQVIADIKEYVDENQRIISLLFENPYIVKFLTPELLLEGLIENEHENVSHKVSFSPWIVMSEDKNMTVPPDWVVTIVEPIDWVKKSYQEKMNQSIDGLARQGGVESTQNFSEFFEDSSDPGEIKNVEVFTEENNGQH
jgi:hypothetical protein